MANIKNGLNFEGTLKLYTREIIGFIKFPEKVYFVYI